MHPISIYVPVPALTLCHLCPCIIFHACIPQGDSGGPLACLVDGVRYQAGVISWGEDCNTTLPAVYTRVSAYTDWITQHGAFYQPEANTARSFAKDPLEYSPEDLLELLKRML